MKKFILVAILVIMAMSLAACGNKQIWDTTYTFNRAIIELPNGDVIDGPVDSWKDYDDGDQIQIVIKGVTYLTHIENAVLIAE